MAEPQEPTHVYVCTKPCGCWAALINDEPDDRRWTASEVAKCIRQGLTPERISFEEYRRRYEAGGLVPSDRCPHTQRQGNLFEEETR